MVVKLIILEGVLVLLILLLSTGECEEQVVVYQLGREGKADNTTRLALWLNDALPPAAPATLSSFTLCLWFKVVTFIKVNSLVSYAIDDFDNNPLAVYPSVDGLIVRYQDVQIDHSTELQPLWWYSACVVVEPGQMSVWVAGEKEVRKEAMKALPLNGSLVLGQEQDQLDNGYSSCQAYIGHVTDLNLWNQALSPDEVQGLAWCHSPKTRPYLAWENLRFVTYNGSAGVVRHSDGPCHNDSPSLSNTLLFFTNRLSWEEARVFMHDNNLSMLVPQAPAHQKAMTAFLTSYYQFCSHPYLKGSYAWLGASYNLSTGLQDVNKEKINVVPSWHPMMEKRISDASECLTTKCTVFQTSSGYWSLSLEPSTRLCSVGVYNKVPPVFNLRINCENSKHQKFTFLSFILTATPTTHPNTGSVYFHGFRKYSIVNNLKEREWCLVKSASTTPTSVACTSSVRLPLGHHEWQQKADICYSGEMKEVSEKPVSLLLSACRRDQFTCRNTSCIPLTKVCDLEYDCDDSKDEQNCYTATVAEGYMRETPPAVPLSFLMNLTIKRINNIDLMNSALNLDFTATITWADEMVQFRHLHWPTRKLVLQNDSAVWKPELLVTNSMEATEFEREILLVERLGHGRIVSSEYVSYIGSECRLQLTLDFRATPHCHFDLHSYPADVQKCNATITVVNVRDLGLKMDPASQVVQCPHQLEQYDVEECHLQYSSPGASFVLQLSLKRRKEHLIWTLYLPSALLLLIGYSTLFLPAALFNERGTMSLTTLLVFISLYTDTTSSLPSTAYLKHIDLWFVFSITYLSFIITTHLATCATAATSPTCPPPPPSAGRKTLPELQEEPRMTKTGWGVSGDPREHFWPPSDAHILKVARIVFSAAVLVFYCYYFYYA